MQKSEVIEFLEKIDAHITQKHAVDLANAKFEVKIIGKCALLLAGMTDPVGTVDLDSLRHYGPEISRVYFEFVEAIKNPRLPEMRNTDGDPMALAEVRYVL